MLTAFVPTPVHRPAPHDFVRSQGLIMFQVVLCSVPLYVEAERTVLTRPEALATARSFEPVGHGQCRLTHGRPDPRSTNTQVYTVLHTRAATTHRARNGLGGLGNGPPACKAFLRKCRCKGETRPQ